MAKKYKLFQKTQNGKQEIPLTDDLENYDGQLIFTDKTKPNIIFSSNKNKIGIGNDTSTTNNRIIFSKLNSDNSWATDTSSTYYDFQGIIQQNGYNLINTNEIVDNVSTDSEAKVLSARQGKVLNDKITTANNSISQEIKDRDEAITSANLLINKNIYNLGAYDTIVNNGDGTATITRQTGYVTLDGNQKVYNWVIDDNYNTLELENMITDYIHFNVYNDNLTMTTIQSNIPHIAANKTPSVVSLVYAYTLRIVYPSSLSIATSEQANDWLSQNPVYIQYQLKTSYTEKVILKQPLLDLPQDGTEWLREEWEKGLNLCIKYEVGHYSLGVYSYLEPNTTYTIKGTSSNSTLTLPNLSINGITYWSDDYSKFLNNGFSFTTKSNLEKGKHLISFDVNVADTSDISNIMLNKGSHALPYKPYSGKLIRQSEFDTLQDKVSSLENQINTTIASLTSQVQELTDRLTASSTRTINKDSINYAYDGTNYSASGGFSVDGQVKSVSVNPATVVVSFNDSVISWSYSSTLKLMKDIVISYTYIANSVQALNELQTLELVDGEYVVEDEIEENVDKQNEK